MKWAFQDRDNLYLVMDQLTGGDLELHLQKFQFTQYQTQFIIACLIIALEYLRTKNIIHRDIKPQNIVFDSSGYIRLTDFGVSKVNKIDNACDTSGTANYMAPEVLCKQNHSFEADYYAIGVIVYEFMFRRKPIIAVDKKELRKKVLDQQISIKKNEVPEGWSIEAADFINQLLQRKPTKRIGYGGIEELKQHPWFDGFEWDLLRKKQLQPLYIPQPITEHNRKPSPYIEPEVQGLDNLLYDDFIQRQFSGYTFANDIDQEDEEQEAYIHPAQQQQKERKYMATIAEE